jgi:hypothetical protein
VSLDPQLYIRRESFVQLPYIPPNNQHMGLTLAVMSVRRCTPNLSSMHTNHNSQTLQPCIHLCHNTR